VSAETLPPFSLPVGIVPDETYPTQTAAFGPGDVLLLATDGITEARVGADLFGQERVAAVARDAFARSASLADMGAALLSAARDFAGGAFHDDVCLCSCAAAIRRRLV
jgi:sigma-B regulation protein RsbU (phosphoserine phosphatase)